MSAIDNLGLDGQYMSNTVQDICRYRLKYILDNYISIDSLKITVFEDYYQFLKANSSYDILQSKYKYKPDFLSLELYNTTKLWELLLFVNNCYSIEEFNRTYVYIPSYNSIYEVLEHQLGEKERTVNLNGIEL